MSRPPISDKIPRLRQRRRKNGTWRIWWEPETAVRALGFEPVELAPSKPTWSLREAEKLNKRVALARDGETVKASRPGGRTISALIDLFTASPDFAKLKPNTKRTYRGFFKQIDDKWGDALVIDLTRGMMVEWYESLYREHSLFVASARLRHMSILLSYAARREWIEANPCQAVRVQSPPRRQRLVSWEEFDALERAAIDLQLPSVHAGLMLAMFQGQRKEDIISARIRDFHRVPGRWIFQQSKRGTVMNLKLRDETLLVIRQFVERVPAEGEDWLLLYERTGRPYTADMFAKAYGQVRAQAAAQRPSAASAQFRDLRRTFSHNARLGGADARARADALGNISDRSDELSQVYNPPTAETADWAIDAVQRPKKRGAG